MLSESELGLLDSPFPFTVSLNADDSHESSAMQFIFDRVNLQDTRYSLEMNAEMSLESSGQGDDTTTAKANYESHRVFYISRADVLYGVKGTAVFKQI